MSETPDDRDAERERLREALARSAKPDDPDWVKAITPEEIERRRAEPGFTFEEVKKRLGWE